MTSLEEIHPFNEPPTHFGGGNVASPTASLKSIRLKSLPRLPKLRGVASSEAKRIYKELASGNFCVEAGEGQVQGHTSLLIDIYLPPSKTNDDDTPSDPNDAAAVRRLLQAQAAQAATARFTGGGFNLQA